jgi:Protein of unknown function (DUF3108)
MNENSTAFCHCPATPLRAGAVRLVSFTLLCLLTLAPEACPLNIPEKLVYDVSWTGVKAGTATQEILVEKDSLRVVSTVRSADWISVFFPVEDRVESVLTKGPPRQVGLPLNFRMKVSEGKHRKDKEIIFDHGKGKARYIDHMNGENATVPIGGQTYDTYSSFYFVRMLPLEVGKSVFVSVLDNKQLWNIEVQVLKKERIKTVLGEVNTILINPLVKNEGMFERKGAIFIWLTDDERRIPVKMKTKVAIGSITATLVGGNY